MISIPEKLDRLKDKSVYLLAMSPEHYVYVREYLPKMLPKNDRPCLYVSLNQPLAYLAHYLDTLGADKSGFRIIDACPAKLSKSPASGALSLTKLSMDITHAADEGKYRFLIFDSLTTLLVYSDQNTAERFMHYLINKLRLLGTGGIILVVNDDASKKVTPTLAQFCDEVLSFD
jgi:KaiC/GvpD/RAD55 family RecA-like ATPase